MPPDEKQFFSKNSQKTNKNYRLRMKQLAWSSIQNFRY